MPTVPDGVHVGLVAPGDRATVRRILDALPHWFGRPEANDAYVAAAGRLPMYVARTADGQTVGILLIEQHFPEAAEIHLMAVAPERHRAGVGRALLGHVEVALRDAGVRMLTVKTLGPSDPDPAYRITREFYAAMGFVPLEEFADLWPGAPCLLMAKAL